MRLSMMIHPFNDRNLQLAAQVGVEEIVVQYPGTDLDALLETKRRVESFGMKLTHIERKVPHLKLVHGLPGQEEQLEVFKKLIRNMAEAEMKVLCYNWMPDEDWQRTSCETRERGDALVTAFDLAKVDNNVTDAEGKPPEPTPAERLWKNLSGFLEELIPLAEDAGIKLALHPDDPPLPSLRGQDRIINSVTALQKVTQLVDSSSNGICFCQGSLAPAGEDIPEAIRKLNGKIVFAHFRNVKGTAEKLQECFHDNGDIDMPEAMRAYHDIGYEGTIRIDHAPSLVGEPNDHPGYEMLGRLYAAGYVKGLMQATRRGQGPERATGEGKEI